MPKQQPHYAPDGVFAGRADQASGVAGPQPGMSPAYPLYGLPLGQTEPAVPFYKEPLFVFPVGVAAGFGLGYLVFHKLLPKIKKNLSEGSK